MPTTFTRKYNQDARVPFTLTHYGITDLASAQATPTLTTADVTLIQDGRPTGSSTVTLNPSTAPTYVDAGTYTQRLLASELTCRRLYILIKDSTATSSQAKRWEDEVILIDTYGDPNAQHGFDQDSPFGPILFTAGEFETPVGSSAAATIESAGGNRRAVWAMDILANQTPNVARFRNVHAFTRKLPAGSRVKVRIWWDNRSGASGTVSWQALFEGFDATTNTDLGADLAPVTVVASNITVPSVSSILTMTELADATTLDPIITIPAHDILSIRVRRRTGLGTVGELSAAVGFYALEIIPVD